MKFKTTFLFLAALMIVALAACQPQPAPEVTPIQGASANPEEEACSIETPCADEIPAPETSSDPAGTVLQTEIGELRYLSAGFVAEANGVTPAPGSKLLLVYVERAGGEAIDLQAFQDAGMDIAIEGDDGSRTISTMAGLVGDRFAAGFQVPATTETYTLVWGENAPFVITPQE